MGQEELLSQIIECLNSTNEKLDNIYNYQVERDKQVDLYIQQKDEQSIAEKELENQKIIEKEKAESEQQDSNLPIDYTQTLENLSKITTSMSKDLATTSSDLKFNNTINISFVAILGLLCGVFFARVIWRKL